MKKIKIDKDSHGTIALMWLICAALAFCDLYFIHNPWVSMPVLALILAFSFFVFWFHRVPDRVLPEGKITTVVDKKGTEETEYSDEEHQISIPMVVLINENSASAAELFTGAIKDYGIATIVGETSYGKGIVQSIFRLEDGSGMKFTTEEYLTPNGNHINGVGVVPDIEVSIPEEAYEDGELTEDEDTQLQKAIEVLTQ